MNDLRSRTTFYTALGRLLLVELGEDEEKFERFMLPLTSKCYIREWEWGFLWLQTTRPKSGGVATAALANCCTNCVDTPRPQQGGGGSDLPK